MRSLVLALVVPLSTLSFAWPLHASLDGVLDTTVRVRMGQAKSKIEPCKLFTDAQVRSVLPDMKGSYQAAAGPSLIKGVDSYQCSYLDAAANTFIVMVHVAADDASFEKIRDSSSRYSDWQKVDIGDAAWMYSKGNKLELSVYKGRASIELQLDDPAAAKKMKQLSDLARALVAKIG